jgi:hypothetical protein
LFQVAETLSEDVLQKMHAAPKATDVPIITPDQLAEAGNYPEILLKNIFFYKIIPFL